MISRYSGWLGVARGEIDQRSEAGRLVFAVVMAFIFIASAFSTMAEIRYLCFGRTTAAELVRTFERTPLRGRRFWKAKERVVEYRFIDAGDERTEADAVSSSWQLDLELPIIVQYLPGSPRNSRLSGHRDWWSVGMFVTALTWLVWLARKIWIESAPDDRPSKIRKRRPRKLKAPPADVPGSTFHSEDRL